MVDLQSADSGEWSLGEATGIPMLVCLWLAMAPPFSLFASPRVQLLCDFAADRLGRSPWGLCDDGSRAEGSLHSARFSQLLHQFQLTGKTLWSFISNTSVRNSRAIQSLIKAGGLYHCLPSCSGEVTSVTVRAQWWQSPNSTNAPEINAGSVRVVA